MICCIKMRGVFSLIAPTLREPEEGRDVEEEVLETALVSSLF